MDIRSLPSAFEADTWFVVFHRNSSIRWLWWIGHFKHISACAYLVGFKAWVVYDVQAKSTRLMFYSHEEWAGGKYQEWTRDCVVVKFKRRDAGRNRIAARFLFYCGPAINHLIGLSCIDCRPDAIYRKLLRNGGEVLARRDASDPS